MRLSSRGIEPLVDVIQFFYREPPLPIGSPALKNNTNSLLTFFINIIYIFYIFNVYNKIPHFCKNSDFCKISSLKM
jgi:hypothetical protein